MSFLYRFFSDLLKIIINEQFYRLLILANDAGTTYKYLVLMCCSLAEIIEPGIISNHCVDLLSMGQVCPNGSRGHFSWERNSFY